LKLSYLNLFLDFKKTVSIHRYIDEHKAEINVKVKAVPLQAWTDPKSSRRLRLPDFETIGT
jgi:hypothetical protein